MTRLGSFTATTLDGSTKDLRDYDGQVVLVVNTASKCGLTPQFEGLEALWQQYRDQGLVVLGFPCNQFREQEPGDAEEIAGFCQRNYRVSFPMFDKIDVNGPAAHPLYVWLRSQKGGLFGDRIKWNFTKFLIGRDGQVLKRYAPSTKPDRIAADIAAALS